MVSTQKAEKEQGSSTSKFKSVDAQTKNPNMSNTMAFARSAREITTKQKITKTNYYL